MANIKVNNSGNIKTYNDIDTIKVPTDVENEYAVFNLKNTNLTPTFEFNIVDEDEFGVGTVPSVTIKNHNYLNGGKELNEILRSLASYKETINSIYSEEEDNQNKKLWEEICKFSSLAKDFLSPENFHSCNEIIKMAIRNKIRCPKYTLHIRIPAEVASEVALKYYPYLDISQLISYIDEIKLLWEENDAKELLEVLASYESDEIPFAPFAKDILDLIDTLIESLEELKETPSIVEFINQFFPICNSTWDGIINTAIAIANSLELSNNINLEDIESEVDFIMKIVYKIIFGIFGGFNGSYDPKYLASLVFGEVSLVEFLDLIFDYKNNNDIVTVICLMILAALYTEGAYFEVYAVTDGEKANKSSPLKIYNTALTVRNETDPSKYNIEAKAKIFEFENEFFCVSGRYGCKDGLVFDFGENASLTSSTDEDSSSSTNTSSETEENSEEETIKITCPTNVYKGNSIWISPGTLDDEIEAKWNLDKGYCKLNTRKNGIYIATWENYLKPKAPDTSELFDTSLFEFTSKLDNSYVRYFKKIGEKYYFDWVKTLIGVSDASGLTFAKSINDNNGRLSEISDSIKYEYIPFYKIQNELLGTGDYIGMIVKLNNGETYFKYYENAASGSGYNVKTIKIENDSFSIPNFHNVLYPSSSTVENYVCSLYEASSFFTESVPYLWTELNFPLKNHIISEDNYEIDYDNDTITFSNINTPIIIEYWEKPKETSESSLEETENNAVEEEKSE